MPKSAVTRICLALLASALAAATAGCGGGGRDAVPTLKITERDFAIRAPKHARAGKVTLLVDNEGPDSHELIVVREGGSRLPLRRDGVTVNEEALEPRIAGTLEPGTSGAIRRLTVRLAPGRYELLCNMSGHYLGGMHAQLVVS